MTESAKLESPIDAMYLIHKALRAEAASVEQMIERLTTGESLQPFQKAFQRWSRTLGYHAEVEDEHMESLDHCWILDWLSQHLTVGEQQQLTGLLARLAEVSPRSAALDVRAATQR
jgi:hypothetical protein